VNQNFTAIWLFLLTLALAGGVYLSSKAPEKAGEVVVATPAKEVTKVEKVELPVKKITVYKTTPTLKKKLSLPKPVIDNDAESILASSKIPAGERAKTVTTVINTETGFSETYVRTDPLPWLAFESRGEAGMYYGIKNGQPAARLQVRQDFIQVKALHVGVIGSVDIAAGGKPDYFVGVGVSYKW